ncbi:MAG TPA: hypothetical protein H9819_03660 [Candidatus Bacteroides merdipullorum]|uniref:Uncharacterized protein n=1 Tax=Candidatus Bacteroides merdipullorum TaxID=2838474 RepID=A0A9D2A883_9BACE|nr:hypothetical protein [Candidatus Bacteroides merdipullorum]
MSIYLTIKTRCSSAATFGKLLKVVARRHQVTLTHSRDKFSLSICRLGNMSFSYQTDEKSGEIALLGRCCTTPAGPGFHKEAVELADEITDLNGYDFRIEDETGYYRNNDFHRLRNNYFLPWLRDILSLCRKQKDGEYLSLAVGWDDEVYLPSDRKGLLITPLGFFNISSLLARLKHPGGLEGFADEFFVWPHEERDALFYRNSALNALWEDCCFMPSKRSAEDKETNAFILDNLEQAARLDSRLPFPKEAYLKLCECADYEPIDLSGLPELQTDYPIGYRKGELIYRLGNLEFRLPGQFIYFEKNGTHGYEDRADTNWHVVQLLAYSYEDGELSYVEQEGWTLLEEHYFEGGEYRLYDLGDGQKDGEYACQLQVLTDHQISLFTFFSNSLEETIRFSRSFAERISTL